MTLHNPRRFIAVQECSGGNESVGDMWLRAATFPPDATLADIWAWSRAGINSGRLIVQPDDNDEV